MLPRSQPPWETWQCPVVSLSCSVLNVSVYCGLLILSHNSVGIFGVLFSLQFQMCILPWLYLPQDTQHFSLPPSCAFPTPSPFLSQSFSVLKNKTAAPLSSKQHTPSPYLLHLSTPFMGFKQSFLGGFNIYLLRAEWVMLKYLFIWTYLVPVSVSSLSGTIAVCKIPRLCVYSMGVFFSLLTNSYLLHLNKVRSHSKLKCISRAGKMAWWIKELAAYPDDLSSSPRKGEKDQLL